MSFSFNVQARDTEEAKKAVSAKLDEVVSNQPIHAKDRDSAQATADDYIDLLGEPPEGKVVNVNVNGSVGWTGEGENQVVTIVGGGISCSFIAAPAEEAAPEAEAEAEAAAEEQAPEAAPEPEPEPA